MDSPKPADASGLVVGRVPFEDRIVHSALWMIELRWLAGAIMIVGAVAAYYLLILAHPTPIVILGVAVIGYNVAALLAIRRKAVVTLRQAQAFWLAQILADMIALTGIVHYTGGVESPVVIFYIIHMVCAGTLLSAALSYLVATLVVALFAAVVAIQVLVPEAFHPLGFNQAVQYSHHWRFLGLEFGGFCGALYASAYLTTTMMRRLRHTEDRIIHQRDVLNSIIASMSEAVLFLAPDGELLLLNPAVARWLDGEAALKGRGVSLPEQLPRQLQRFVEQVRKSPSPLPAKSFTLDVAAPPEGAGRHIRCTASGVFDHSGRHIGYVVVGEDLTDRLQLEDHLRSRNRKILAMSETLRRNQEEMAQREKMVAIGTMAAGIVHEVGNPLACLSAIAQLLQRGRGGEEDRRHFADLNEQVQRIATILRQLLEFARPPTSERVPTNLDELIEQTVRIVRYSSRARHVPIESIPNPALPEVLLMPQQFQQVLVNVLLNALDAMIEPKREGGVRIERFFKNGWVTTSVQDQGVGMTAEQARQAFEPFYTTKAPGKGTGLGLAVSYRLVEQQAGRIRIDSAPNRGTTVTISFRAARKAAEVAGP